jgi:DNA-binding HxlR family transcriptional regulator
VEATLDVLGGFKALVVWHLFWGARTFSDLRDLTPEVPRAVLRAEIADLERHGLVRREARPGGARDTSFALTPRGETLKPVVAAMYEWGLHHGRA